MTEICVKISKPKQMATILQTTILNTFSWGENYILTQNLPKIFPWGLIDNSSTLIQLMAWHWAVHKPTCEAIVPDPLTYPCVVGTVLDGWSVASTHWGQNKMYTYHIKPIFQYVSMKTESCHDAKFVVTAGTADCHNDNLRAITDDKVGTMKTLCYRFFYFL